MSLSLNQRYTISDLLQKQSAYETRAWLNEINPGLQLDIDNDWKKNPNSPAFRALISYIANYYAVQNYQKEQRQIQQWIQAIQTKIENQIEDLASNQNSDSQNFEEHHQTEITMQKESLAVLLVKIQQAELELTRTNEKLRNSLQNQENLIKKVQQNEKLEPLVERLTQANKNTQDELRDVTEAMKIIHSQSNSENLKPSQIKSFIASLTGFKQKFSEEAEELQKIRKEFKKTSKELEQQQRKLNSLKDQYHSLNTTEIRPNPANKKNHAEQEDLEYTTRRNSRI